MTDDPKDLLIEQAASAYRSRDAWGRIQPSPVWHDLAPQEREAAHARQLTNRAIESSLDPKGWSTTVRTVLERLRK